MLGKRQLALVECAREKLKLSDESFARMLASAGAARLEELTPAGYAELMDECTILGFRDIRRPVLSAETLGMLDSAIIICRLSDFERASLLRHYGRVGDPRELDGMGLCHLLARLEKLGRDVQGFIAGRRTVTRKQLALIHIARQKLEMDQETYSSLLVYYGGVNSAADLDQRGFDLVMARMRHDGFETRKRAPAAPTFGRRPGFASPEQLTLICNLWAEWSGASGEVALNAWLDRYQGVTNLRFLTAAKAGKAIMGLKAMKARDGKKRPEQVSA